MSRVVARCPFGLPGRRGDLPVRRRRQALPDALLPDVPDIRGRRVAAGERRRRAALVRAPAAEPALRELACAGGGRGAPPPPGSWSRRYDLPMIDDGASLATGVGGVGDARAVKCLHAHVAHALAHPALRSSGAPCWRRSTTRGVTTGAARPSSPCRRRAGVVRVAVVDLGTNTCRLFLAEVEAARDVTGRRA